MFELAERPHALDGEAYAARVPALREALLDAQVQLVRERKLPVIVIIAGVDGAGKGEVVHRLNEWMDPRHIETHAMGDEDGLEYERPPMWRYWMKLPPKGSMAVFFGSWYTAPIYDRAYARIKRATFDRGLDEIARFEKMIVDEGALVVKIWLHLSKKAQRARFKKLTRSRKTRWRVSESDWENHARYGRFKRTAEIAMRRTSSDHSPWVLIDGEDRHYRDVTVGEVMLAALRKRLAGPDERPSTRQPLLLAPIEGKRPLSEIDLTKTLDKDTYDKRIEVCQGELNLLSRKLQQRGRSLTVAFEGFDAAGKGGAIRRVTGALDARHYRIVPIAAPTDEERQRPYLWRFWRHVPARGEVALFDRSWYGRVLVERVEKLCSESDRMRAYSEINDFEEQLSEHGSVVVKVWLSITKDEQLRRFEERQKTPFKQFKITDEDWRNRERWDDYEAAANEMIERTSTERAPWTLVEGNDKSYSRIKVLETLIERLRHEL